MIPHKTNDTLKEKQKTFSKIVEALARIIHLIGKQDIAYRGTEEKVVVWKSWKLFSDSLGDC